MTLKRLSVELVPRSIESLLREEKLTREIFPQADTLNIPDITRFKVRSWQGASSLHLFQHVIPHIRAIDVAPDQPLPGSDTQLQELLVIHGDPPTDLNTQTFPNSSEDIIRRYKKELPDRTIYAAFDPYRRPLWEELDDVKRKKDAGADGFFTQPFFDLAFFHFCRELLYHENVFWGISPVIGSRSLAYWENTNHVVFTPSFEPTLDANITLAQQILSELSHDQGQAYIMPVKIKLEDYLPHLRKAVS